MSEKSYVTLALCPICQKETGALLMDKRLRPTFGMHTMTPEPCDKCREKYLSQGVMLINPENGNLVVLKDDAFVRIFNRSIPEGKIAFVKNDVLERLQVNG